MELDRLDLKPEECSILASLRLTDGFKILNKVLKGETFRKLNILLNTPIDDEKLVIANHRSAKASAEQYAWLINAINEATSTHVGLEKAKEIIDPTSGLLDLGDFLREEDE